SRPSCRASSGRRTAGLLIPVLCGTTLRPCELIVVTLRTRRVGHRERCQRIVKGGALSHVPREHGRIGRARMRTGKRAPAQARVIDEGTLLDEFADGAEPPVLQLAHVEMSARRRVLRPPQEDVARRLHDMLTFDDPPAGVTLEFGPEAFEHGFSRFL